MMGDMNDVFMRNQSTPMQARPKAHNRANVVQQKLIAQSHQTGLTPDLLKLFAPRPPLEYKPPTEKRKCLPYAGMAQFVSNFAEPGDPEYAPPPKKAETSLERRSRIHKLRLENGARKAAEDLEKYDPSSDPNVSGDPYKTLFVARLTYEATESKIKREFEKYGPIKKVRMVTAETTNKPRGYAFIEYMHTRDMKAAYKQADGMKLDNRRVLVDVERGRTVPNWRPRRLGGGLGSTRVGGQDVNMKFSGREPQQLTAGGPSRSEEPRSREERPVERVREREREREKSRELSHDRRRDREPREERRHKERDRRDRDKDREHGRGHERSRDRDTDRGKDRDRARDRERDGGRKRPREMDRDHDQEELDRGRERSRDEDFNYEHGESKKGRHRRGDRDRDHDHSEGRYEFPENENGHFEDPRDLGQYNHLASQDEPSEHKTNSD